MNRYKIKRNLQFFRRYWHKYPVRCSFCNEPIYLKSSGLYPIFSNMSDRKPHMCKDFLKEFRDPPKFLVELDRRLHG